MTKKDKNLLVANGPSEKLIKAAIIAHETHGSMAMAFKSAVSR